MADVVDELVVQVRADTSGFMTGVGDISRALDGPLASGVDRAGRGLERSLSRAVLTGKLGFDDLGRMALGVINDIAASALKLDFGSLLGGGGGGLLGSLFGVPGRAIGGPVAPSRPFLVGERGPELFVPTSAGRVETLQASGGRPVNITVNLSAPAGASPGLLRESGAQVARAVARALQRAEG